MERVLQHPHQPLRMLLRQVVQQQGEKTADGFDGGQPALRLQVIIELILFAP
ncbi:hypothetical protein D3C76_1754790 [compost metagenome]